MISKNSRLKLAKMLQMFGWAQVVEGPEIYWEGELAPETEVFTQDADGEMIPLENGTYTTEDGLDIEVAEGKVVTVNAKEPDNTPDPIQNDDQEPEPEPEPEPTDDEKDVKIKELEDTIAERDAEIEKLEARIKELEDLVKEKEEMSSQLEEQLKMSAAKPAHEEIKINTNIEKYI